MSRLGVLARTYGARGLLLRVEHEARRAGGLYPRHARHVPAGGARPGAAFVVARAQLAQVTDVAEALARADHVAAGWHQAYRWEWRRLPASDAEWHVHPFTRESADSSRPWWRLGLGSENYGDVKDAWEPARFGWAYDLVRGHAVSGNPAYARAFDDTLAAWEASSLPFRGIHWACGQEASIRAIALLYAEANLPCDRGRVARILAATGERVASAMGYAISQRNNHGLSEATGLIALGARLQGVHPAADAWFARGRRWLERLVREQFAPDGWYIQHSFAYLRLALDQCVIAQRVLATRGLSLSEGARDRLGAALALLLSVMDRRTGRVPNHGANDGAFVHPITLGDYPDFRPIVTAVAATFGFALPEDVVMDHEVLAWLGAAPPPSVARAPGGVRHGASGWASAAVGHWRVFLRAGSYSSRPSHIDPLHLDVTFAGRELVVDPGTYAYNAPAPWRNGLAGAEVHNGPVEGAGASRVGSPFLWLEWPAARLIRAEGDESSAVLLAEIPGCVRREVRMTPENVSVRDTVLRDTTQSVRVRWTLHPQAASRTVMTDVPAMVRSGEDSDPVGWFSPHYGERIRTRVVEFALGSATREANTVFAPCFD